MSKSIKPLPPIPEKIYFTIGEASQLCAVKPHVLRYWEQEFSALKPSKRRGGRRYYQHKDVLLIREIRDLLYMQGFTIAGAKHKLNSHRSAKIEVEPQTVQQVQEEQTVVQPQSGVSSLPLQIIIQELQSLLKEIK